MGNDETGYAYGTVLEHPFIRGLRYMVLCEGPRRSMNEMQTLVLSESGYGRDDTGNIVICNGYRPRNDQYDWLVIDE